MAKDKKTVSGLYLAIQTGTSSTVYAKWNDPKLGKQDGYHVVWKYGTGDGTWFDGSTDDPKNEQSIYTPPSNATKVKCSVKPKPKDKADWEGSYSSQTLKLGPTGKYAVSGLYIKLKSGTKSTLFAAWDKLDVEGLDGYEVVWQYETGQGVWFDDSNSTTSSTNDSYSVDTDIALKVKVKVTPKPSSTARWTGKTTSCLYTDGFPKDDESKDDDSGSWDGGGGWDDGGYESDSGDDKATTPSNISVTIKGTTVTAIVTNYKSKNSDGLLRFEIVENDSVVVAEGDAQTAFGIAKFSWTGTNLQDKYYKARAMAYGSENKEDSDWSAYCANVNADMPAVPKSPEIEIDDNKVIATVSSYRDDKCTGSLRIQIVENDETVIKEEDVLLRFDTAVLEWSGGDIRNNHYKAKAMAYGVGGNNSDWSAYGSNVWVPEQPAPAVPTGVDLTITGSRLTASLVNYQDANANGTVRFQVVENDLVVVHEANVNNLNGIATMVWDLAKLGGNRYKVRVMAFGSKGVDSPWSVYSANKYTSPGITTGLTLAAASPSSVNVRWTATNGADTYVLQYTATVIDGQPAFDTGSSDVQEVRDIFATYYPAQSLTMAKRWYFRVKAVNEGGDGTWSNIVSVMLGTRPDIPSVWSYTSVGKIGDAVVLNWVHSSQDDSDQSGARVAIKINDGVETVISLTTESTYSYDTSSLHDGDKIKWRVCTRGVQGIENEWGPYSEYREVVVYAPPEVNVVAGYPDPVEIYSVINSFPINIRLSSAPLSQTPVAYHVSITSDSQYDISGADGIEIHVNVGQEVYSKYIPSSDHELTVVVNPGDVYLDRDALYTINVTVAMTNGLSADNTRQIYTKWINPDWVPSAEVTVDKTTLVAYIRPYCLNARGYEIKGWYTLSVYRIGYDGELDLIGKDLDPAKRLTITDLHPGLDYARYRIVATDGMTGGVTYTDLEGIPVGANCIVIQWEGEARAVYMETDDVDYVINDWSGTILRLPYNIDVSDDISPDVSLVEYIGRKHPVSYYGTQKGVTSRWSAEIPITDVESIAKLRALAIYPGDVYVREPSGTGYWANVKVSYNIQYSKRTVPVSLAITRVEGGA